CTASGNVRYGVVQNGKIWYADKGDGTINCFGEDGVKTTVITSENIKGLGMTFDQAGNIIAQAQAFPNATSQEFVIFAKEGDSYVEQPVVSFAGDGDDCISAMRVDVLGQAIGDIMSEQGGVFYIPASLTVMVPDETTGEEKPKVTNKVSIVYFQSGAKGNYNNIGGYASGVEVTLALDNNTVTNPYYETMDALMAAYDEGIPVENMYLLRKRGNGAKVQWLGADGSETDLVNYCVAAEGAFTTSGLATFTLAGVEYAVMPISIGAHTRNFHVVRVSDGVTVAKSSFTEVAAPSGQLGISVEKVDENTVNIASVIYSGANVLGAVAQFAVASEPEPEVAVYWDNQYTSWEKVYAYAWGEAGNNNADWPGVEVTDVTAEGLYKYVITDATWNQIIFNNGNGEQTGNLALEAGKVYSMAPETPENMYIMGHIAGVKVGEEVVTGPAFNPTFGYSCTNLGSGLYEIDNVRISESSLGSGYGYFAFTSALGANAEDWATVNSHRYGPQVNDTEISKGDVTPVKAGVDASWKIAATPDGEEGYKFTLDVINGTLTVGEASAASIVSSENAPAVYYNLQGVEVANPQNGLYIVKRGNTVTKQVIR
ncbi:MAG: starch-binding protein, partial [Muribaculaceae bacterium]